MTTNTNRLDLAARSGAVLEALQGLSTNQLAVLADADVSERFDELLNEALATGPRNRAQGSVSLLWGATSWGYQIAAHRVLEIAQRDVADARRMAAALKMAA